MKKFVKEYKYQFWLFCNKIFFHESKLKRHKKNHNKVTFPCTICSKSYYREDYFRKHEQNCQNFDISFSINKNNDFIPRFIESCFYVNGNDIVSNNPLDNSESITNLSENKNNGASLVSDKTENDASDNFLVESEVDISSEKFGLD